jgi:hypothetical protein
VPLGFTKSCNGNIAIAGESAGSIGVRGISHAEYVPGVMGINDNTSGRQGPGVYGESLGTAIWGKSNGWVAVFGETANTNGGAAVMGQHSAGGIAVLGSSTDGPGVMGQSFGTAVHGRSTGWVGVFGESDSTNGGAAILGQHNKGGAGVSGIGGIGVFGKGPRAAGWFEGDVVVTGDISLTNADCAEDFTIASDTPIDAGSVVVLSSHGGLVPCERAYDRRAVGVVSGAGNYKPGIVLDRHESTSTRQPVALLGKVFCKVDAGFGAIAIGDLLTTSTTPGHAMKVVEPAAAFGAVIGKALGGLDSGCGLVPILIALQ